MYIWSTELKARCNFEDKFEIILLFCNEKICCDPSLEPSCCDFSKKGHECMLLCCDPTLEPSL